MDIDKISTSEENHLKSMDALAQPTRLKKLGTVSRYKWMNLLLEEDNIKM